MLVANVTSTPPEGWDALIGNLPRGVTMSSQCTDSTRWAQSVHEVQVFYVQIKDGKIPVLIAKFYYYPELELSKYPFLKKITVGSGNLVCANGPLIVNKTNNFTKVCKYFFQTIMNLRRKVNAQCIMIQPAYDLRSPFCITYDYLDPLTKYKFIKKLWATLYIDLSMEEDELWQSLHNSIRTAVRKCQNFGCYIKKIENISEYKDLYLSNYDGWSRYKYTEEKIPKIWESFPANTELFVVVDKSGQKVYSGISFSEYNGVVGVGNMFLTSGAKIDKIPAQDFLIWEKIKSYKIAGASFFDLCGINPNPTDKKEENIAYFKKKFSKKNMCYPIFIYEKKSFIMRSYVYLKSLVKKNVITLS